MLRSRSATARPTASGSAAAPVSSSRTHSVPSGRAAKARRVSASPSTVPSADRRVAGGVERGQRPLRHHARGGVGSVILRRGREASPSSARDLECERALAGGGQHRVGSSTALASPSRPSAREPGERPARARRIAVGELAQARVDVAAQLDDLEVVARREQLRRRRSDVRADACARRAARRATRRRQRVARVCARRHRGDLSPSGSSPGTSLAECTARSISAGQQRVLELRRPSATCRRPARPAVAGRRDLDELGVAAARPPPAGPAPAPARCPACRSSLAAPARARAPRRPARCVLGRALAARRRPSVEAEQLAQRLHVGVRAVAVELLQPQRRLVQQPRRRPRAPSPRPARGRASDSDSQRASFSRRTCSTIASRALAQRRDRRAPPRASPSQRAKRWISSSMMRLGRRGPRPRGPRGCARPPPAGRRCRRA